MEDIFLFHHTTSIHRTLKLLLLIMILFFRFM